MKAATIGLRMHSGWGALVVVAGNRPKIDVLHRQRVVVADPQIPGAKQPYHFAAGMELSAAEQYLAKCAAASEGLALVALRNLLQELLSRSYRIIGSAVLLASGRPLPALSEILASHAAIHTAEGVFFRDAICTACKRLDLPVTGIRERDLDEQAHAAFGPLTSQLQRRIAGLKKTLGSPWTEDEKKASLAASIVSRTHQQPP
jgi:hypothetical protein